MFRRMLLSETCAECIFFVEPSCTARGHATCKNSGISLVRCIRDGYRNEVFLKRVVRNYGVVDSVTGLLYN